VYLLSMIRNKQHSNIQMSYFIVLGEPSVVFFFYQTVAFFLDPTV